MLPGQGSVPAQPCRGWDAPAGYIELGHTCALLVPVTSPHTHRAATSLLPVVLDPSSHREESNFWGHRGNARGDGGAGGLQVCFSTT